MSDIERAMAIVGPKPANFSGDQLDYAIGMLRLSGPDQGGWSANARAASPMIDAFCRYAEKRGKTLSTDEFAAFCMGYIAAGIEAEKKDAG